MHKLLILTILLVTASLAIKAQNYYWIGFSDKNNSPYSISSPEEYLSERAIERRLNQNIQIDSLDLPVNSEYVDSVLTLDVEFVHASKWLNGITVKTNSDTLSKVVSDWSFIKDIQRTKPAIISKSAFNKFDDEAMEGQLSIDTSYYGLSVHQVGMLEGDFLHDMNFKGQGMHIAVLDGGFLNADTLPAFDSLWTNNQILGVKDFVDEDVDFYSTNYHGMSVLSCMGGNIPGQLIGTAPKASYWLLRSEQTGSEYIVEEDNWVVAAEFADSVGVDIINSSLGYYEFDDETTNHTYADMDGKTTRVTRAANIAASRGILVFASAGNERNDPWQRIIAPSDGDQVIGVGAVDVNLSPAYFTSAGPAADGDIKPNVSAMGYQTAAQLSAGTLGRINGTSFSSPVLAGMVACLWQRYPDKTAEEIKEAVEKAGHIYNSPDSLVGYGVPSMKTASAILDPLTVEDIEVNRKWNVFPNPVTDHLIIQNKGAVNGNNITIELYSITGRKIKQWIKPAGLRIELNDIPLVSGIAFLRIESENETKTFKLSLVN